MAELQESDLLFDGKNPREWIRRIESIFEIHQFDESEKLPTAMCYFDRDAMNWLRIEDDRRWFTDWSDLKQATIAHFDPLTQSRVIYSQLQIDSLVNVQHQLLELETCSTTSSTTTDPMKDGLKPMELLRSDSTLTDKPRFKLDLSNKNETTTDLVEDVDEALNQVEAVEEVANLIGDDEKAPNVIGASIESANFLSTSNQTNLIGSDAIETELICVVEDTMKPFDGNRGATRVLGDPPVAMSDQPLVLTTRDRASNSGKNDQIASENRIHQIFYIFSSVRATSTASAKKRKTTWPSFVKDREKPTRH